MNYQKNETFSFRKSSFGLVSVVIGLFITAPVVQADSGQAVQAETALLADADVEAVSNQATDPNMSSVTDTVADTEVTTIPESNQLIHVEPLWREDIKGQGQIVAIIDSGLDATSDAMRISDVTNARIQSEAATEDLKQNAGISYGKWVNAKVIYAHNYNDWNDEVKEAETRSHGMIVASSAVANPSLPSPNGELVPGVAPEAQLMFMRVFSDQHSGTQPYIYLKAVEDAINLGADVINLSLGGEAALTNEVGKLTNEMAALAREKGILITAAAGNSEVFGFGYDNPSTENPDYGLVSRPSVARNILSVGAMNNSVNNVEVVTIPQLAIGDQLTVEERRIYAFEANKLSPNQEFSYVSIVNGAIEDFAGKELTDKIALVLRSQESATAIVANAIKAGAAGVLIANDAERGETVRGEFVEDGEQEIPVAFIGYKAGQVLAQHQSDFTLLFDGTRLKIPHEKANELLDFTSWGFSGDGFIKPDIIAPGGRVFAAINDGRYDTDQGTSFSAPHVAGAAALIKQVLSERFPQLQGADLHDTIKGLIMSQANPHIDPETAAYTSPRRQGAGMVDVSKAAFGEVIATGTDGYPSLSLGNVQEQLQLDLLLNNIGSDTKQVSLSYVVNTDQAENGHVTLRPRVLKEVTLDQVLTLPAGQKTALQLAVDTSEFTAELRQTFPNGYFLEGFVFIQDAKTGEKLASIPYAGFKGEFQNLPAFEKPIYDFSADNKPFYYFEKASQEKDPENNFTALTGIKEINQEPVEIVLGEHYDETAGTYSYDRSHLASSPNGDHQLDDISLKVTALRNYENVQLTIYAKDDTERQNPLFQQGNERGDKNYFDEGIDKKSETLEATLWDGSDQEGNLLPDGDYQYVVRYRPAASGAQIQELAFLVTLDTVAPQIEGNPGDFDPSSRIFTPSAILETGSGVESIQLLVQQGQQTTVLTPTEGGSFQLPDGVELADVELLMTDYAGNQTRLNLAGQENTVEPGEQEEKPATAEKAKKTAEKTGPSLEVQFIVDGKVKPRYNSTGRYIVTDSAGQRVPGEFVVNKSTLPEIELGTYKVELVLLGENLELLSPKVVEVSLTEENPNQVVTFEVVKHSLNKFDILFDQDVPVGTRVYAIDEKGVQTELLFGTLDKRTFEDRLPNGNYRIVVELPAGYEVSENHFTYEVGDKLNRQLLSLSYKEPELVTPPTVLVPVEFHPVFVRDEVTVPSTSFGKESQSEQVLPLAIETDKAVDVAAMLDTQEAPEPKTGRVLLPKTGSQTSMVAYLGIFLQLLLVPFYLGTRKD